MVPWWFYPVPHAAPHDQLTHGAGGTTWGMPRRYHLITGKGLVRDALEGAEDAAVPKRVRGRSRIPLGMWGVGVETGGRDRRHALTQNTRSTGQNAHFLQPPRPPPPLPLRNGPPWPSERRWSSPAGISQGSVLVQFVMLIPQRALAFCR